MQLVSGYPCSVPGYPYSIPVQFLAVPAPSLSIPAPSLAVTAPSLYTPAPSLAVPGAYHILSLSLVCRSLYSLFINADVSFVRCNRLCWWF